MKSKNKPKSKGNDTKIIVPKTQDIIIPGKKKVETLNMMLTVPFTFKTDETMEQINERLDEVITTNRNKTLESIAKVLGLKVNWEN